MGGGRGGGGGGGGRGRGRGRVIIDRGGNGGTDGSLAIIITVVVVDTVAVLVVIVADTYSAQNYMHSLDMHLQTVFRIDVGPQFDVKAKLLNRYLVNVKTQFF